MLEVQPALGTASLLLFQQGRQSRADRWVPSLSSTPVHPISIVRTPIASDLDVSLDRDFVVEGERDQTFRDTRCRKDPARVSLGLVAVEYPSGRLLGVSPVRPVTELGPHQIIEPTESGFTYPAAVVIGPSPNFGIELLDQGDLRPCLRFPYDPTELREMIRHVGFGRFDQGFVPERSPSRCFSGLVLSHSILTNVETEKIHSGLIPFQRVTDPSLGCVQRQSDVGQPRCQEVLAVF